eukprot:scaffold51999_cov72-Phaeocystis_antarctica.AAC.4
MLSRRGLAAQDGRSWWNAPNNLIYLSSATAPQPNPHKLAPRVWTDKKKKCGPGRIKWKIYLSCAPAAAQSVQRQTGAERRRRQTDDIRESQLGRETMCLVCGRTLDTHSDPGSRRESNPKSNVQSQIIETQTQYQHMECPDRVAGPQGAHLPQITHAARVVTSPPRCRGLDLAAGNELRLDLDLRGAAGCRCKGGRMPELVGADVLRRERAAHPSGAPRGLDVCGSAPGVHQAPRILEMVEPIEPDEAGASGAEEAADAPVLPTAPVRLQSGGGVKHARVLPLPPRQHGRLLLESLLLRRGHEPAVLLLGGGRGGFPLRQGGFLPPREQPGRAAVLRVR